MRKSRVASEGAPRAGRSAGQGLKKSGVQRAVAVKPVEAVVLLPVLKPVPETSGAAVRPPVKRRKVAAPQGAVPVAMPPAAIALPPNAEGVDFDLLSQNLAAFVEKSTLVAMALMKPAVDKGEMKASMPESVADAVKAFGRVAEHWLRDPSRSMEAQARFTGQIFDLWGQTWRRMAGEDAPAVAVAEPGDKRFKDPAWRQMPFFDFLSQAYQIANRWAGDMTREADIDPLTREKAQFYLRQISAAVSPSNFIATNPKLLTETIRQNGSNLVRGMDMLAEDIVAGEGQIKLRQSDSRPFELGVNMATTPGKVVFRNELIELIQYAPATPNVLKRPLLIIPPWINKYYILDLNPEKSFVAFARDQGVSVFVVSWVNPDGRHATKSFAEYMHEGLFAACDTISKITGEREVNAIGYCVGGTLLAVALAYEAQRGPKRIASATLFTTQVDFSDPGDLKVFSDEAQIAATEAEMAQKGYLDGAKMANAFNMLRPEDLIWSYVVANYMKGEAPKPFDLLTWNSDSTRMAAANHSFYLRNCYLYNNLTKGKMVVDGVRLDLGKVMVPVYNLAAREDHIAPAASVFRGAQFFGGPMRYVLAGSGHIAGVINPPAKVKYQYWLGDTPKGELKDWLPQASEYPGSWWLDWIDWLKQQNSAQVPAREVGGGVITPLCDAPGTYVRVKA